MKKLAICVPYRDREEHLNTFIPHIDSFFADKRIDYKVFICNQVDTKKFNRGKTKNIAFDVAMKEGYDYFAFHDIDLLPEDDSCDYSYPEHFPIHLSAFLSQNDYKILFPENFGGVVLFTKEQFIEVNGYYNEYWNWGAEDDDLYWRCMQRNFSHKTLLKRDAVAQNVVHFDGKKSCIKIPATKQLNKMMQGSFTMTFLVKSDSREDVSEYLWGEEGAEHISIPILSRHGLDIIAYGNTLSFTASYWDRNNKGAHIWSKRDQDLWTYVTYRVDVERNEAALFINGCDTHHENRGEFFHSTKEFYDTPLYIGYNDYPIWSGEFHNYFKGSVGEIVFWDKALDFDEIEKVMSESCQSVCPENVVAHYDFNAATASLLPDKSGNGNNGELVNCTIQKEVVDHIIISELPHRRDGRFLCLPHESEGLQDGRYKDEDGVENERILREQVKEGKIDTAKNGLNNLTYKLLSKEVIAGKHVMLNVEC